MTRKHMTGNRRALLVMVVFGIALLAPLAALATSVTIFFDNQDLEEGVTPRGTREFSFMGSNWMGGAIRLTLSPLPTYTVITFTEIGTVTFDDPIDSVEFLFFSGTAETPRGRATAFNSAGDPIQAVDALDLRDLQGFNVQGFDATAPPVDEHFVRLDPNEPIARIVFEGGIISHFTFTPVPEPTTGALVALGATLLAARSTRRPSRFPSTDVAHRRSRR